MLYLLIRVFRFGCYAVKEKLLSQRVDDASAGRYKRAIEDESSSSIGGGIVEVRQSPRAKITSDTGVVELCLSVVAFTQERRHSGMTKAGLLAALPLIEVARVLMEKRRENSSSDQDVSKTCGE